jgi:hypothetical protein
VIERGGHSDFPEGELLKDIQQEGMSRKLMELHILNQDASCKKMEVKNKAMFPVCGLFRAVYYCDPRYVTD